MFAALLVAACAAGVAAWLLLEAARAGLARYRAVYTREAGLRLAEAFLFVDPARIWAANVALALLAGLLAAALSASLPLAVLAGGAGLLVPHWSFKRLRRRRWQRLDAQLPDALQALAGGLRAGISLPAALRQVAQESPAPLGQELELVLREQRLGVGFDRSLADFAVRVPTEACVLSVAALRIASETGGNLAEALDRIAAMVRARLHMHGRIDALTAQGRLQAWIVAALPPLLALVLDRLEPQAMAALWHTPAGWITLLVVLLMESAGLLLIRRIVQVDV
ncbi:type II secretion system F family protein [Verticiella sediminum]|nr:type II secretion system F family protein [Verticiella sediminum]